MIEPIFPSPDPGRGQSAPDVDLPGYPRPLLDRHNLNPLGQLTVPGEDRPTGDGYVCVAESV
jgi:hypothetical protein